jgi:hypothetical protein
MLDLVVRKLTARLRRLMKKLRWKVIGHMLVICLTLPSAEFIFCVHTSLYTFMHTRPVTFCRGILITNVCIHPTTGILYIYIYICIYLGM